MTGSNTDTGTTPPLRSREIEFDNPETFLLLKAAARAATETAISKKASLSDAPKKKSLLGALSDPQRAKIIADRERLSEIITDKPLSDASGKTGALSDAQNSDPLSDPMPVIRRSALDKLGILATPGRHLIFTHKGAKQICRVAR